MLVVLKGPPAVMWSVFFVFLSYLDRNFVKGDFLRHSLDAVKESNEIFYMINRTFCNKMSSIGENYLHQVTDGIEEVRSVRDHMGNLVDCSVTDNQIQVKSFLYVCKLGLKDQGVKPEYSARSLTNMEEARSNCQAFRMRSQLAKSTIKPSTAPGPQMVSEETKESSAPGDSRQSLHRSKRGFTYPGTLWCGAGNIADHYDHLGEFAETDSCCRVHDHCPYVIHPFSTKFGYTNFKWHSICHCDCDNTLKECLRKVNDTSSRVVGQAFFNVIEVPCFEFVYEEQCVERHWYGVCKRYDKVPVAVARESIPYDFGGIDVIDELTIAPRVHKKPKTVEGEEGNTTQPTASGSQTTSSPEEPSLGNVVTAAEDFIKVLATVSTSHSSSTEATKENTQGNDKKKKKKTTKKRKNHHRKKEMGKRRRRKQRISGLSKTEETAVGTHSCRAEEVIDKKHFEDNDVNLKLDRNLNNGMDTALDFSKDEISHNVINDEPQKAVDDSSGEVTASNIVVKKEPTDLESQLVEGYTEKGPLSTTVSTSTMTPLKAKKHRLKERKGRNKKRKTTTSIPTTAVTLSSTIRDKPQGVTNDIPVTTPTSSTAHQKISGELEPPTLESYTETPFLTKTSSTPTMTLLKTKRQKSKERQGRKKRRKTLVLSPHFQ